MRSFLLLVVNLTVLVLLVSASGKDEKSRCRFSQDVMAQKIMKYTSECLKRGFQDSKMGCVGDADKKLTKMVHYKKCYNLDKYLHKCGHTCHNSSERSDIKRWRDDGLCGHRYLLPDGNVTECNPYSDKPCCGYYGSCEERDYECSCSDCIDYRIVRAIEKSGNTCTVMPIRGFLKNVCANADTKSRTYFKCVHSDVYYESFLELDFDSYEFRIDSVSTVCENDPRAYQACGFNTEITNKDVLCSGYLNKLHGSFISCLSGSRSYCYSSDSNSQTASICDDQCDYRGCEDEGHCHGHMYGVFCASWLGGYLPVSFVCDGRVDCYDSDNDELHCAVTESTSHTCLHFASKMMWNDNVIVPILNNTRCSVFDVTTHNFPYCADYLDQTNCTDPRRVGGYCRINGYFSTVSKYVVCQGNTNEPTSLCDNNMENECLSPSASCTVHKHRMCDGMVDCPDASDEFHVMCDAMTPEHKCRRTFGSRESIPFPVAWIMDNQTDCMDESDESVERWNDTDHSDYQNEQWMLCGENEIGTFRVNYHNISCQDGFPCPEGAIPYIDLDVYCDWTESCGVYNGNAFCQIARDSPLINMTAVPQYGSVKDSCNYLQFKGAKACVIKEFTRPSGDVFGAAKISVNVPTSKVDCSNVFGEYYVYLSCMNLCLNSNCPLDNNVLLYDSCPAQFPDRIFTLANNSYLTFVTETYSGEYQQDYFQCKNRKCVRYQEVCDLVDDCGDFSDEINCSNHKILEHRVGLNMKSWIPYRKIKSRKLALLPRT